MRLKKNIVLILLTVFTMTQVKAQHNELYNEFKALNSYYMNLDAYAVDFEIKYQAFDGNVLMNQQGSVLKSEKINFFELEGIATLVRDGRYVSVDRDNETMFYSEFDPSFMQKNQQDINAGAVLDSLWKNQESLRYKILKSNNSFLHVFVEDIKGDYFSGYEFEIDREKHQLLSYKYYLKPDTEGAGDVESITIRYFNETDKPKLKQDKLKLKYYVLNHKNDIKLAEQFENYQLIDQTKILATYE